MAKFSRIIRESNENLLITKFIEIFKGKLNKKKQSSKRLSFVLTGGKTPIRLYKKLANLKNLDWKKVDFFIGDERYVSKNSKNSNINLCRKYLLNKINVSHKQVFQINTNNNSIEKDTKEYEDKIKRYFLHRFKFECVEFEFTYLSSPIKKSIFLHCIFLVLLSSL